MRRPRSTRPTQLARPTSPAPRPVGLHRPSTPVDERRRFNARGLYPYQVDAIRWLHERAPCNSLLCDEMGLGKTATVLRSLAVRARTIVLCPKSLGLMWRDQTLRWRPDLRPILADELARPDPGELLILAYSSLPPCPWGTIRALAPQLNLSDVGLVLDEVHACKDPTALRTRRANLLRRQCAYAIGLTGTPLLGHPEDLWGVLVAAGVAHEVFPRGWCELDGDGRPVPGSFVYQFQGRRVGNRGRRYVWTGPRPGTRELLRTVLLQRHVADVALDLPRRSHFDVPVDVPHDLTPLLAAASARWDAWVADNGGNTDDLPPFELFAQARAALALSRADFALGWVRGALKESDRPLVVFGHHLGPLQRLAAEIPGVGLMTGQSTPEPHQRQALVDRFQRGELRCLAMSIQTGGAGFTLTRADRALFIDRDYTPGWNAQAEGRLVRIGSAFDVVRFWRLVSDHPLDRRLARILDRKQGLISATLG